MIDNKKTWEGNRQFNDFGSYFKKRFTERIQKVAIDAGFTCPNRDGTVSIGGCTYCNNNSFNPAYCNPKKTISTQIDEGIDFFYAKYKAQKYLAYFQAYSNTYGEFDKIKALYDEALSHPKVVGLVVATRPDCMYQIVLDYLEKLAKKHYVAIEYGVESANNKALEAVNRGHSYELAEETILRTANKGINIGVHLINGLPYETKDSMLESAIKISKLPIDSIKFHQLQVLKNTAMETEYKNHPERFSLFHMEDYLNLMVDIIEQMNPNIMIERFINQAPLDWVIGPKWGIKNYEFVNKLDNILKARNSWQGKYFKG
ncbi:MAG: TIGR01212 family radical SAM protein [Marinifilaceae bacterium]|jgi:radical SAM protein (TIGR01212 family)|nr:TIGR01212 family radical SAM protein [Marinifilaceae bacterium]